MKYRVCVFRLIDHLNLKKSLDYLGKLLTLISIRQKSLCSSSTKRRRHLLLIAWILEEEEKAKHTPPYVNNEIIFDKKKY